MDNLRAVIKNLFCYISTGEILEETVVYNNISENVFMQLGTGYITKYSNDELSNMYYYLENEFQWQSRKMSGGYSNLVAIIKMRSVITSIPIPTTRHSFFSLYLSFF